MDEILASAEPPSTPPRAQAEIACGSAQQRKGTNQRSPTEETDKSEDPKYPHQQTFKKPSLLNLCADLFHHLPHRRCRTRRSLFPPSFQPLTRFFDAGKKSGILERSPPRRHDRRACGPTPPRSRRYFRKTTHR